MHQSSQNLKVESARWMMPKDWFVVSAYPCGAAIPASAPLHCEILWNFIVRLASTLLVLQDLAVPGIQITMEWHHSSPDLKGQIVCVPLPSFLRFSYRSHGSPAMHKCAIKALPEGRYLKVVQSQMTSWCRPLFPEGLLGLRSSIRARQASLSAISH